MSTNITGNLVQSETVDGNTEQIWEIPAFREQGAIRKARLNAELKGITNITVLNVREIDSSRIPGQTVFRVTIEAPR